MSVHRHSFGTPEQFEDGKSRDMRTVTLDEMDRLLNSDTLAKFRTFPHNIYHVWIHDEKDFIVYEVVDQ